MKISLIDFNLAVEYSKQPHLTKLVAGTAGYLVLAFGAPSGVAVGRWRLAFLDSLIGVCLT